MAVTSKKVFVFFGQTGDKSSLLPITHANAAAACPLSRKEPGKGPVLTDTSFCIPDSFILTPYLVDSAINPTHLSQGVT